MSELLELAERCEQATGPSAETDMRIAAALGGPPYHNLPTEFYPNTSAPRYTASLDAAMTLYVRIPQRVPSSPLLAAAEALRQRAEEV